MRDMDDAEGLVTDSAGVQRIGDLDVFAMSLEQGSLKDHQKIH